MDQGLESDQHAADSADCQSLEDREPEAGSGEAAGDEPVEADQAQPRPLRDRERGVGLEHARGGEEEEDRGKGDAQGDRTDVIEDASHLFAPDAPAVARLGADDLAVELCESDRGRGGEQGARHHSRARWMGLESDDERHPDDRAVDDARDLAASEMGFDRPAHARTLAVAQRGHPGALMDSSSTGAASARLHRRRREPEQPAGDGRTLHQDATVAVGSSPITRGG